jgi:hypothetical protein
MSDLFHSATWGPADVVVVGVVGGLVFRGAAIVAAWLVGAAMQVASKAFSLGKGKSPKYPSA